LGAFSGDFSYVFMSSLYRVIVEKLASDRQRRGIATSSALRPCGLADRSANNFKLFISYLLSHIFMNWYFMSIWGC